MLDDVAERAAGERRGAAALRRGAAPGARWRAAELQRRRTLLGEAPAEPAPWRRAAAAFDALALPMPATYARYRAARGATSRPATARPPTVPLRAAATAAAGMGAALLLADVEALARRARIDLAEAAPEPGAATEDSPVARLGLTPRELEVLLLVAEGRTNRAIGETLFMSEKTASVHVSRILAKLGVHGRVEAAAVAHRLGLAGAAR